MEHECYSQAQFATLGAPPGSFVTDVRSVTGALPSYAGVQAHPESSHWQFPVHGGPNQVGPYHYRQGVQFTGPVLHQVSTHELSAAHLWRHPQSNYPSYVGVPSGPQLQPFQNPGFQIPQGMFQTKTGRPQSQAAQFPLFPLSISVWYWVHR